MLAAPANSTSTATSGAFSRPGTAAPRQAKKRNTSRSQMPAAAEGENNTNNASNPQAPAGDLPITSLNTGNDGGETCSLGNGQAEAVSPLKAGGKRATLRATPSKVVRSSQHAAPGGSSRPRVQQTRLDGPVFSKPVFVVAFLVVLAAILLNWNARKSNIQIPTAIQVKELEEFSKTTTKWMQVQLELVDMKIGKEIEGLRKEVEVKMEDQTLSLGTSIKNLKAQVVGMENSLQKLTEEGLLTRKEGMELVNSIIQQRVDEIDAGKAVSLDDVRIAARQIVEAELEKHSADGIGRVDYALRSGGGKVIDHSEGFFTGSRTSRLSILGGGLSAGGSVKHPMAQKVLEPSFGQPGECLPLKGNDVFLEIALRTAIHPDAITLEHVPRSVAYNVNSAPKDFKVFGWLEKSIQADTIANPVRKMLLGEFTYSLDKPNVQTFDFPEEVTAQLINTVRVHVTSNYGSPSHTCIYRIRVHGFEPRSRP